MPAVAQRPARRAGGVHRGRGGLPPACYVVFVVYFCSCYFSFKRKQNIFYLFCIIVFLFIDVHLFSLAYHVISYYIRLQHDMWHMLYCSIVWYVIPHYGMRHITLSCCVMLYGRFSKVHGLNVIPDPGVFELSEGLLK